MIGKNDDESVSSVDLKRYEALCKRGLLRLHPDLPEFLELRRKKQPISEIQEEIEPVSVR